MTQTLTLNRLPVLIVKTEAIEGRSLLDKIMSYALAALIIK